jgi:hypothetical protein
MGEGEVILPNTCISMDEIGFHVPNATIPQAHDAGNTALSRESDERGNTG